MADDFNLAADTSGYIKPIRDAVKATNDLTTAQETFINASKKTDEATGRQVQTLTTLNKKGELVKQTWVQAAKANQTVTEGFKKQATQTITNQKNIKKYNDELERTQRILSQAGLSNNEIQSLPLEDRTSLSNDFAAEQKKVISEVQALKVAARKADLAAEQASENKRLALLKKFHKIATADNKKATNDYRKAWADAHREDKKRTDETIKLYAAMFDKIEKEQQQALEKERIAKKKLLDVARQAAQERIRLEAQTKAKLAADKENAAQLERSKAKTILEINRKLAQEKIKLQEKERAELRETAKVAVKVEREKAKTVLDTARQAAQKRLSLEAETQAKLTALANRGPIVRRNTEPTPAGLGGTGSPGQAKQALASPSTQKKALAYKQIQKDIIGANVAQGKLNESIRKGGKEATFMALSMKDIARSVAFSAVFQSISAVQNALRESIELTLKWERAIAEVRTISDVTAKDVKTLTTELAEGFGVDRLVATEAAYQSFSNQVVQTSDEMRDFLGIAVELGTVGLASTDDAVNALSSVLKSYNKDVSESREISAQLFKTVELGRVRLGDMANTLGTVSVPAAQLGVEFDELQAIIATTTVQGIKYNRAQSLLRGLLTKLISPTDEMKGLLAEMGYESAQLAIQGEGLAGVFKFIEERTKGSASELGKLFSRVRATSQGMILASEEGGKQYENSLREIRKAAFDVRKEIRSGGKEISNYTERVKEIKETADFKINKEFEELNSVVIETGESILGIIDATIGFERIAETTLIATTALFVGLGSALVGLVIPAFGSATVAAFGLSAAVSSIPGVALITLLTAIGATSIYMVSQLIKGEDTLDKFNKAMSSSSQASKELTEDLTEMVRVNEDLQKAFERFVAKNIAQKIRSLNKDIKGLEDTLGSLSKRSKADLADVVSSFQEATGKVKQGVIDLQTSIAKSGTTKEAIKINLEIETQRVIANLQNDLRVINELKLSPILTLEENASRLDAQIADVTKRLGSASSEQAKLQLQDILKGLTDKRYELDLALGGNVTTKELEKKILAEGAISRSEAKLKDLNKALEFYTRLQSEAGLDNPLEKTTETYDRLTKAQQEARDELNEFRKTPPPVLDAELIEVYNTRLRFLKGNLTEASTEVAIFGRILADLEAGSDLDYSSEIERITVGLNTANSEQSRLSAQVDVFNDNRSKSASEILEQEIAILKTQAQRAGDQATSAPDGTEAIKNLERQSSINEKVFAREQELAKLKRSELIRQGKAAFALSKDESNSDKARIQAATNLADIREKLRQTVSSEATALLDLEKKRLDVLKTQQETKAKILKTEQERAKKLRDQEYELLDAKERIQAELDKGRKASADILFAQLKKMAVLVKSQGGRLSEFQALVDSAKVAIELSKKDSEVEGIKDQSAQDIADAKDLTDISSKAEEIRDIAVKEAEALRDNLVAIQKALFDSDLARRGGTSDAPSNSFTRGTTDRDNLQQQFLTAATNQANLGADATPEARVKASQELVKALLDLRYDINESLNSDAVDSDQKETFTALAKTVTETLSQAGTSPARQELIDTQVETIRTSNSLLEEIRDKLPTAEDEQRAVQELFDRIRKNRDNDQTTTRSPVVPFQQQDTQEVIASAPVFNIDISGDVSEETLDLVEQRFGRMYNNAIRTGQIA